MIVTGAKTLSSTIVGTSASKVAVGGDGDELAARPRGVGRAGTRGQLVERQAPFGRRVAQAPDRLLALVVRGEDLVTHGVTAL